MSYASQKQRNEILFKHPLIKLMRPTHCDFRAPNTKSGEYVMPLSTYDGTRLAFPKRVQSKVSKVRHTMGCEQRFEKLRLMEKLQSSYPGPASYIHSNPFLTIEAKISASHHSVS